MAQGHFSAQPALSLYPGVRAHALGSGRMRWGHGRCTGVMAGVLGSRAHCFEKVCHLTNVGSQWL
ncbi:rCG63560 [Rattus norvegicus]|uniref:RCG63560 n=1 Tax=Rattus norvegicus TaxID=10116 RepID=A6IWT9_RAT|nr:rCG63560 [Rattus norvegicus]